MGIAPPQWHQHYLVDNRIAAVFISIFLFNAIINAMLQTGAFEVTLDGETVWSKLASGQPPAGGQFAAFMNRLDAIYRAK